MNLTITTNHRILDDKFKTKTAAMYEEIINTRKVQI